MRRLFCFLLMIFTPTALAAQETYHNPVDGKDYTADHWQSYQAQPQSQKPQTYKRIKNEGVVLLTSQQEIAASITPVALANYIMSIEAVLNQDIQNRTDNGKVMVQVELIKGSRPTIQMSRKGNLSDSFLQDVYDHLDNASYPEVKGVNVKFQVMFSIAGA